MRSREKAKLCKNQINASNREIYSNGCRDWNNVGKNEGVESDFRRRAKQHKIDTAGMDTLTGTVSPSEAKAN